MIHGKIFSCSTASGPAFEGAHIHDGMRAAPGAVDDVTFSNGEWIISTIDDLPPVGICGTGILNAVSALLDTNIINNQGRLVKGSPPGKTGKQVSSPSSSQLRELRITDTKSLSPARISTRSSSRRVPSGLALKLCWKKQESALKKYRIGSSPARSAPTCAWKAPSGLGCCPTCRRSGLSRWAMPREWAPGKCCFPPTNVNRPNSWPKKPRISN